MAWIRDSSSALRGLERSRERLKERWRMLQGALSPGLPGVRAHRVALLQSLSSARTGRRDGCMSLVETSRWSCCLLHSDCIVQEVMAHCRTRRMEGRAWRSRRRRWVLRTVKVSVWWSLLYANNQNRQFLFFSVPVLLFCVFATLNGCGARVMLCCGWPWCLYAGVLCPGCSCIRLLMVAIGFGV